MMALAMVLLQSSGIERAEGGLGPLALAFMLVSIGSVAALTIWCYSRILRGKEHFDPDGTGPAHAPVKGSAEPED